MAPLLRFFGSVEPTVRIDEVFLDEDLEIFDGEITAQKLEGADTFFWNGPHTFASDLNVEGVLTLKNPSMKLETAVTCTTDNGSGFWFNLKSDLKTAGILLYPLVPSLTLTANDGAGNYSTIGMSSGGMNLQFVGTADLAINGTIAALNEVIVGQGNNVPPKLEHLCPPIRYAWTDFESASVQMTSPYIGAAISTGTSSTAPSATFFVPGTQGLLLVRCSATSNSGYRWVTEYSDRIVGQAYLYFRAVLAISDDMASKTVRFGFHDTTSITDVVDGTYFELAPGSMVCSARSANNSTRSSHGTTFTLTANTFYIFEIYWTSTGSINYKIKSLDEATTHLNVDKTTDIPTGTSRLFGAGLVATSTILAADDLIVVDYMGHGLKNKR